MKRRQVPAALAGMALSAKARAEKAPAFDERWTHDWNAFAEASRVFIDQLKAGNLDLKQWNKRVLPAARRVGVPLGEGCVPNAG